MSGAAADLASWTSTYTMRGESNSFILYEPYTLDVRAGVMFKFRFKATEPTALLFYVIDDKADRCYVQLTLKGGRLSLNFRMSMKVQFLLFNIK